MQRIAERFGDRALMISRSVGVSAGFPNHRNSSRWAMLGVLDSGHGQL